MHKFFLLVFLVDLAGSIAGIYAMQWREFDRKFMAISGGVLLGVGSFWIWPEIAQQIGAIHSLLIISVALAALYAFDRYLYPLCPCCSHHARRTCRVAPLALFPLAMAISLHNFFDGWIAGLAGYMAFAARSGIVVGLLAHKIPEGALFGIMLRSATKNGRSALIAAIITASTILLGGFSHDWFPFADPRTVMLSLVLTCASFLFLGGHIFWRQRQLFGTRAAVFALASGVVGTVVLAKGATIFG